MHQHVKPTPQEKVFSAIKTGRTRQNPPPLSNVLPLLEAAYKLPAGLIGNGAVLGSGSTNRKRLVTGANKHLLTQRSRGEGVLLHDPAPDQMLVDDQIKHFGSEPPVPNSLGIDHRHRALLAHPQAVHLASQNLAVAGWFGPGLQARIPRPAGRRGSQPQLLAASLEVNPQPVGFLTGSTPGVALACTEEHMAAGAPDG